MTVGGNAKEIRDTMIVSMHGLLFDKNLCFLRLVGALSLFDLFYIIGFAIKQHQFGIGGYDGSVADSVVTGQRDSFDATACLFIFVDFCQGKA